MGDALQGCEGRMQATVGAGPEGSETVAVQVCVILWQASCQGWAPAKCHPPPKCPSGTFPEALRAMGPTWELCPWTKVKRGGGVRGGVFLKSHLQGRRVHAYREAVVGEEISDCVAPLCGVGGQGGAAKEARKMGGGWDGLGSHIHVLGF